MSVESRSSYGDNPIARLRADHQVDGFEEGLPNVECFKSPPRILAFMGASGSGKDVAIEILTSLPGRMGISKKLELEKPITMRVVPKITDRPPRMDEVTKIPVTQDQFDELKNAGRLFAEYTLPSNGARYAYRYDDFKPACREEFLVAEPSIMHIMALKERFGDLLHCTFLASSRSYRDRLLNKRATETPDEIYRRLDEGDGQNYIALLLAGRPVEFINQFVSPEIAGYFEKLIDTDPKDWDKGVYKQELSEKIGPDLVKLLESSLSSKGQVVDELINVDSFKTFIDDIVILEDKFITDNPYEAGLFSESVIDSATRMLLNSENRVHSVDQTSNSFIISNLVVPEAAREIDTVFGLSYEKIREAISDNQKDRMLIFDDAPQEFFGNIRWVSYYEDRNQVFGLIIRDPNNPESIMSFRATKPDTSEEASIEFQIQLQPIKDASERYMTQMAFMSQALKLCELLNVKKFHYAEHFDLVDENDVVIGLVPREVAHQNEKYIHRAASVMLWRWHEDPATKQKVKQLFMVRRSKNKKMNANIWQPAASGHLLPGETYAEAARRELREEIGSSFARKVKALHPIKQVHIYTDETTSPYPQRENFSFFIASIDEDTSNGVATNYEAGSAAWMDVSTIKDMLARHPEEFRDAFRIAFDTIDWDTLSETQIHTVEKH